MKWRSVEGYRRVSKWIARKLYDDGVEVYMCPCNLRPGEPWHPEVAVRLSDGEEFPCAPAPFEDVVRGFQFFNCSYSAGYYPAFYVGDDVQYKRK